MILTIFLILFLLFIIYLLTVPMVLCIDTTSNRYYVQLKGLVKASIEKHEKELLRINVKVAFLHFYFYPLREIGINKQKKIKNKNIKKKRKRIGIKKSILILKSFKVKKLLIDIDTGDYILNAKLFPLVGFLNYKIGKFNINFEGRNRMALYMQNRPINIIKLFINS